MKRGQLEKPRRMRSHFGCFSPSRAPGPGSQEFDNLCPGGFQNCYRPVLQVVEWEHLLWFSCPFLTTVCLVGVKGWEEAGTENSPQLSRSRGAASTSGRSADCEMLNFEPHAFMR